MSYLLGIIIDGARVKDEDGRIISFLFYGLSYPEIGDCMDYSAKTIRNRVCELYSDLGVQSEVQDLLRKAYAYDFDYHGNYKGKSVLYPADRKRMLRVAPRLGKEKPPPA
jgi:hypothetical protein